LRARKKEYLEAKIEELETNSKIKNIGDLYKGDLVTDSHSILARWTNHFFQLFNVSDVRQTEKHTAEPPVPEPGAFEVETAIEKPKRHKSPGTDQIPAELMKAGD